MRVKIWVPSEQFADTLISAYREHAVIEKVEPTWQERSFAWGFAFGVFFVAQGLTLVMWVR